MKKLFALIGITLCLGLGTCLTSHYSNVQIAFAEESETTEVLTEETFEEKVYTLVDDNVSFTLTLKSETEYTLVGIKDGTELSVSGTYEVIKENVLSLHLGNDCMQVKLNDDGTFEDYFEPYTDSEEVEEEPTFYETLSQTAKDCIGVAKEVLNQPIVVAGVSTTLGAIVLLVISKLLSAISSKKEREKVVTIVKSLESLLDRKDLSINEIKNELGAFIQVMTLLVNNLKNVNVKNECLALLNKLDPIKESAKTFIESEKDLVVEDTKQEIKKDTETLLDILNK